MRSILALFILALAGTVTAQAPLPPAAGPVTPQTNQNAITSGTQIIGYLADFKPAYCGYVANISQGKFNVVFRLMAADGKTTSTSKWIAPAIGFAKLKIGGLAPQSKAWNLWIDAVTTPSLTLVFHGSILNGSPPTSPRTLDILEKMRELTNDEFDNFMRDYEDALIAQGLNEANVKGAKAALRIGAANWSPKALARAKAARTAQLALQDAAADDAGIQPGGQ